ncbi:hypothetical protein B0H63DRAFT_524520 [Podospora didyma]|uniref:Uncharacterized protein n=1 Tax=Podospora didyma TaxID=330526 RepID=A0AAE0NI17_9PEZI|nr:hypothetical protein B0H63DRAFT_524520 [Podospora didyma]
MALVISPQEYLKRTQEVYVESAKRCDSTMQSISLAFEVELADIARHDSRITMMDGKQMKSIAVLTMILLPGTFLATFIAAPSGIQWNGDERPWLFWALVVPVALVVLIVYLWWTKKWTRGKEVGVGGNADKGRNLMPF